MTFQEQQLNVNSCAMSTHGNKWLAETIKIANNIYLNLDHEIFPLQQFD